MPSPIARGLRIAAAVSAVSLFGSADSPNPVNTAAVAESRPADPWTERHACFVERSKKGGVEVLFLGDSITHRWEVEGKAVWAELPAPWKVAEYGIGGDRTQHLLWRIGAGKELAGIDPKVIVVLIGTNNIGNNSPAEIEAGANAILIELRKQKPNSHVLLLGLLPRGGMPVPPGDRVAPAESLQPKVVEINGRLAKFDDDTVTYLDLGSKFLDGDGGLPQKLMPDYLHLSSEGYAVLAEALRKPVDDLLSGKPAPKAHAKAAFRRVDALRGHLMMWVSAASW